MIVWAISLTKTMTTIMTHLELSEKLALAIGWRQDQIRIYPTGTLYCPCATDTTVGIVFDYRNWAVIGPIATRYNCFPINASEQWQVEYITKITDKNGSVRFNEIAFGQTPQEAIAKAVLRITLYPDN